MSQLTVDARARRAPATGHARVRNAAVRLLRALPWAVLALTLGVATVWAFLAYRNPDMVIDFARLLQMCGIQVAR